MQRSIALCLRAEGFEPPILLGKFWRFSREWGPPFRNKASMSLMRGAFHVVAGRFTDARDALAQHSITVVTCQGMGMDSAWERILHRLGIARPTAVLLDDYYLPIHQTLYQKTHATHVYAVGGYDATARVVTIFNVSQTIETWPIPLDIFITAWATEEFPWFDLLLPPVHPLYTTDALKENYRQNVAHMMPQHPGEHWGNGVPAIRRLASDLATYPDRFAPEALKDILEDGFHQLAGIREQRWLYATGLQLVASQLSLDPLVDISQRFESLGKAWSAARNWCMRATEIDLDKGVRRLVEKLNEIADAEETTAVALQNLLDSSQWPQGNPIDLHLHLSDVVPD